MRFAVSSSYNYLLAMTLTILRDGPRMTLKNGWLERNLLAALTLTVKDEDEDEEDDDLDEEWGFVLFFS
ncbi:unnamed protein product [Prunus armeniaca]|uniref:Uncharacterized protein n=1 Tax=Prunus armeniaca TaxID=36596 RepID=A0A6J5XX03_PRUAR|nr:unnamed protein product [Prunus armeniaca]